ncbi:hypothetical protein KBK19_17695 [Microvirga sp. STR05]|uniref:Lipoprotein n=1 Tax=Hymenobacter duratus TaxID=2771356 RepID=A0ABR8JNC5_9BACT|nr:hypothetical protein [Hymenobacter duratus]MBD2716882.1 hypothetical protein [Hymenobacter duratus]MBR7951798.1 hypothetical protein [Microvirga sp. STR05]
MRYPLLLLLLLLSLTGCPKKKDPYPELVKVTFVVPARIEPGGDVVALGDTLWLDLDAPDSLLDLRSNTRYRVPGQELLLRSAIGFYKLTGPTQARQGYARGFAVVPDIGRLEQGSGTSVLFEPVYDAGRQRHRARVGMVPRERGVFALSLITLLPEPYGPERPLPFLAVPPGADGRRRAGTAGHSGQLLLRAQRWQRAFRLAAAAQPGVLHAA